MRRLSKRQDTPSQAHLSENQYTSKKPPAMPPAVPPESRAHHRRVYKRGFRAPPRPQGMPAARSVPRGSHTSCRATSADFSLHSQYPNLRSAKYVNLIRQITCIVFGKIRALRSAKYVVGVRQKANGQAASQQARRKSFFDAILFDCTNYRLSPMYIEGS